MSGQGAPGAVIRGGTRHFDYVASGVTIGLVQASVETGVPIGFGNPHVRRRGPGAA